MMMSFQNYKVLLEKRLIDCLHIKQRWFSLHHFITVYYCKWKEEIRRERKEEIRRERKEERESQKRRKKRKKAKMKEKKKARKEERKNRKKKRKKE